MADLCPFSDFNFGAVVEDKYSSSDNAFWNTSENHLLHHQVLKDVPISGAEEWGDSDFRFFSDHEYLSQADYLLSTTNQQKRQISFLDCGSLDDLRFDMVVSPPLDDAIKFDHQPPDMADLSQPTMIDENPQNQSQNLSFPITSLGLLNNYGNGFRRLNGETEADQNNVQLQPTDDLTVRKLSTEDVMRLAATKFIQSSSSDQSEGLISLTSHPYYDFSSSGLSDEEKVDVELAQSLLASAEKVGFQQFERASRLLHHCESLSSKTGNAVKRVVYYFSEALRERINRETGRAWAPFSPVGEIPDHYHRYIEEPCSFFDPNQAMLTPNPADIACHEELPFSQVAEFPGIQAIAEKLNNAKRIHIIDLGIRRGWQWTILMQALQSRRECPVELLKITAVGTTTKQLLEDTGKKLTNFAESMNISFCFDIVMLSDMLELKEDLFKRDGEETVAVYSKFVLRSMIQQPDQLEAVMRVIRNLNPIVMVVTEVEANHNSTSFVNRFTEALFYFSAFFDCLETCMKREDPNRVVLESLYLSHGMRNIVAAEGEDRKVRNVKIDVWRSFFRRFGMEEEELSMSSLYQAELVAKRFACGRFCTFEMNGNCLLSGWKGTPLQSLSVWNFL